MRNAATLDRHEEKEAETDAVDVIKEDKEILRRIHAARNECRKQYHHLSSATRSMYEDMFDDLERKREADMMEENVGYLDANVEVIQAYEKKFLNDLKDLATGEDRIISMEDAVDRLAWFHDDSLLEMTRKKMLETDFPKWKARWKKIADDRKDVLKTMDGTLTEKDVPGINVFRDDTKFFSLSEGKRKDLVRRMEAFDMGAAKDRLTTCKTIDAHLAKATTGKDRYLHSSQAGTFLKNALAADKPESYVANILVPSLEALRATRASFDALGKDAHPLMKLPALDAFLQWNADKRTAFLAEYGRRKAEMETEETATREREEAKAFDAKLIERKMNMGDWEGADLFLRNARETYPEDKAFVVMERYLESHRTDLEEEAERKTVTDATRDIRTLFAEVPHSARGLYAKALDGGSETFGAMVEGLYHGARAVPEDTQTPAPKTKARLPKPKEKKDGEGIELDDDGSKDGQAEALAALTEEESLFASAEEKRLTLENVTAERQMLYHTQLNLPMLRTLRFLESKGERFKMAG